MFYKDLKISLKLTTELNKCVILVKSHIFSTLCHTSFLDSTKCDFNSRFN